MRPFLFVVLAAAVAAPATAGAVEPLKLEPDERERIAARRVQKLPTLLSFEVTLDGNKGVVDATVQGEVHPQVTARSVLLDLLGGLYVALPGDPPAPLGPGGRLSVPGGRPDLVWKILLRAGDGPKPPIVADYTFLTQYEPIGHDTGSPSFVLAPGGSDMRGPWWLEAGNEARSNCVEAVLNPWREDRYWYDSSGAIPVRVHKKGKKRDEETRMTFAREPKPRFGYRVRFGNESFAEDFILETPELLLSVRDGKHTPSMKLRWDGKRLVWRQGIGEGGGTTVEFIWKSGRLVEQVQRHPIRKDRVFTKRFLTETGPRGLPTRFEEQWVEHPGNWVTVYDAAGRARATLHLEERAWPTAKDRPPHRRIKWSYWHTWACK